MSDDTELVRLDLSDPEIGARLLELQHNAYRVEADLVGSDDIPPLHETFEELVGSEEVFLGALVDGLVVGAVSWKILDGTLDIHRLFVDPSFFRGGIGASLVRAALAAEPTATSAVVQTGAANEPARTLYLGEGFEQVDEIEAAPGLHVARFTKSLR